MSRFAEQLSDITEEHYNVKYSTIHTIYSLCLGFCQGPPLGQNRKLNSSDFLHFTICVIHFNELFYIQRFLLFILREKSWQPKSSTLTKYILVFILDLIAMLIISNY